MDLLQSPGRFFLPIFILAVFAYVRLNGIEPPVEGLGDHVTALWFIFGASATYLGFIKTNNMWWFLASILLLLLATDEVFMVHESISNYFFISELWIFGIYALALVSLILFGPLSALEGWSFRFFMAFVLMSVCSVTLDQFVVEGTFGNIGIEQQLENIAALSLCFSFTNIYLKEI